MNKFAWCKWPLILLAKYFLTAITSQMKSSFLLIFPLHFASLSTPLSTKFIKRSSYKSGYNALSITSSSTITTVNSHTDVTLLTKINQNLHEKKNEFRGHYEKNTRRANVYCHRLPAFSHTEVPVWIWNKLAVWATIATMAALTIGGSNESKLLSVEQLISKIAYSYFKGT